MPVGVPVVLLYQYFFLGTLSVSVFCTDSSSFFSSSSHSPLRATRCLLLGVAFLHPYRMKCCSSPCHPALIYGDACWMAVKRSSCHPRSLSRPRSFPPRRRSQELGSSVCCRCELITRSRHPGLHPRSRRGERAQAGASDSVQVLRKLESRLRRWDPLQWHVGARAGFSGGN